MNVSHVFLAFVCSIIFALLPQVSSSVNTEALPLCLWGQDCTGQTCVKGTTCLALNIGFPKLGTCVENLIPAARLAACVATMDAGCTTNADCCNPAATCQATTPCTVFPTAAAGTCKTGKTCQLPACRQRV